MIASLMSPLLGSRRAIQELHETGSSRCLEKVTRQKNSFSRKAVGCFVTAIDDVDFAANYRGMACNVGKWVDPTN